MKHVVMRIVVVACITVAVLGGIYWVTISDDVRELNSVTDEALERGHVLSFSVTIRNAIGPIAACLAEPGAVVLPPTDGGPACSSSVAAKKYTARTGEELIWPDLSTYDAKWSGCDLVAKIVYLKTLEVRYCATYSNGDVYECIAEGCTKLTR